MPKWTPVARCVERLMKEGKDKVTAIKICQKSTGLAYRTGKPPKREGKEK